MSRKPTPPATAVPAPLNQHVYDADSQAATALGEHQAIALAETQRLAQQFSYSGEVSKPALRAQLRRETGNYGASSLAIGATLLMLRALCPHGEFTAMVEAEGYNQRTARRFMSIALRFSKSANLAVLTHAASSQSKLLELAFLDDEDLELLAQGGEVSGITLDKIETMTASELRQMVRERDEEADESRKKRDGQANRIEELQKELRRFNRLPPDQRLPILQAKATSAMNDVLGGVLGALRQACQEIQQLGAEMSAPPDHNNLFLAGLFGQVLAAVNEVRAEHRLPEPPVQVEMDWQKAIREEREKQARDKAAAATSGKSAS